MKLKALFIPLFLTGCAVDLQDQINRLEKSLNDVRTYQAEQTTQLSDLQTQVRALQGKAEELEYSQNKKIGSEVDTLKDELSQVKKRVPPPAVVPADTLEDDERLAQSLPEEVATRFYQSLQTLRDGRFNDAIPLLQTTLDASTGEAYSALVLFWLGVGYEGAGDNRQALLAYNQVVTQYPKSQRVPLSLLRQAGVMSKIGDKTGATAILKKITVDHPNTAEGAIARQRLSGKTK